jgi:hypothetical protein
MKQLTVLVPNEIGVAARLTTCLADHGVNIEEIDLEGMENRGIVVLTVDRYDDALRALSDQGFRVITQNTLLIRLQDRPGALATVAVRLKNANLDVRSMHILSRHEGGVIVSLVASDNAKAAEVLKDVLVTEHQ